MTRSKRIGLAASLVLAFTACKKEEAAKVVSAPLSAPTTSDDTAWGAYVTDVVRRNLGNTTNSPYVYYLPAEDSPDFQGGYDRLLEKAQGDCGGGHAQCAGALLRHRRKGRRARSHLGRDVGKGERVHRSEVHRACHAGDEQHAVDHRKCRRG